MTQLLSATLPRQDSKDTPNPEYLHVFVDGSCTRPDNHTYKTRYSVVMLPDIIIESKPLRATSAQQAELIALTRACQLFEGQDVNIYTDSRYAFGVIYDFGCIWQNRGFKTADNKPIANQQHVGALLKALLLPRHINVIKIRGHSYDKTEITKGNALPDKAKGGSSP